MLFAMAPARAAARSADRAVPAPNFELPTRTGSVSLDSLRGKVVLVDFWASWCAPCARSFPWLAAMEERYAAQGLAIVAIDLDHDREAADAFLERHPAPFQVAFDAGGKTAEAFKVRGMPSSFLIGPDGALLYTHVGFDPRKAGTLEERIRQACSP
jgi:cytochrome c biogenesis protein CcmG/thiol:disulfide interchange protein DsbE